MKILLIIGAIILSVVAIVVVGLLIKPVSFPPFPQEEGAISAMPLPNGLPAPVERFYSTVYGETVPVVTSAVITGSVRMRPFGGVTFNGRFRFTHEAGKAYRHYMEASFFGLPLMKINEWYIDGKSRLELPFGTVENEPKVNQAANLGLWGESIWFPSIFVTDERVVWEEFDDNAAILVVPYEGGEDRFMVYFDPITYMPTLFTAMRFREANDERKTLWLSHAKEWGVKNGRTILTEGTLTWFGDKQPWAEFFVEEVVYNVDVDEYLRQKGL